MNGSSKKSLNKAAKRVLGDKAFEAITAVEGLKLAHTAKKRMAAMRARKLTPSQKRAEVLRAYSSGKVG
jgi:hypothetical protein